MDWSIRFCFGILLALYKYCFPKIVFTLEACKQTAYQRPPTNKYFYFFSIKNQANYTIKLLNIYATAGRLCKENKANEITKPYEQWCLSNDDSILPIVSISQPEKF